MLSRAQLKILLAVWLSAAILISGAVLAKLLIPTYFPDSVAAHFIIALSNKVSGRETPQPNNAPPVVELVWQEIAPGEVKDIGEWRVQFSVVPAHVVANQDVNFLWKVTDTKGSPVPLDLSVHNVASHAYLVRDDLSSDLLHIHPTQQKNVAGMWASDPLKLPSGGAWNLVMQFSKNGTIINLASRINVEGDTKPFTPDFTRVRQLPDWTVRMEGDTAHVRVGEPVSLTFRVVSKNKKNPPKLEGVILNSGHNFIVAHQNDLFVWNFHGDKSVEKVSEKLGIPGTRAPQDREPFSHTISFPKPGLWLVHFEIQNQPARFFVNVQP